MKRFIIALSFAALLAGMAVASSAIATPVTIDVATTMPTPQPGLSIEVGVATGLDASPANAPDSALRVPQNSTESFLDKVKDFLRGTLGPAYGPALTLGGILVPFFNPHNLNWIFVLSAILIASVLYTRSEAGRQQLSLRGLFRFLAPREVFLHPSAILDYKFYVVNSLLLSQLRLGAFVGGVAGLLAVAQVTESLLTTVLDISPEQGAPQWQAQFAFTVAMTVVMDFSKWLTHYLQHRIRVLWEFHKVHHSAAVLTPISNYRIHPVDFMLEKLVSAILVGVVAGCFSAFYTEDLTIMTILNISAITFFYFLQSNLRHSHIRLHFSGSLSRIFSSPAMHQVHHSCEARHIDKNFALMLSLWDQLAGTNYIPERDEEYRLGLTAGEDREFNSLYTLYVKPFQNVLARFKRVPEPGV